MRNGKVKFLGFIWNFKPIFAVLYVFTFAMASFGGILLGLIEWSNGNPWPFICGTIVTAICVMRAEDMMTWLEKDDTPPTEEIER